jgi:hypothetical protein
MPNPLDPIWQAYDVTQDSFGVVRRSLGLGPTRDAALQGSQFLALADQQVVDLLDSAQDMIDDQAVMFLYATFEAALRDHVAAQSGLFSGATLPSPQFGITMQPWFAELCRETRMDKMANLFSPSADKTLIEQAGSIRKYRHWLAHGKTGKAPTSVTPLFAYTPLTRFLFSCALI